MDAHVKYLIIFLRRILFDRVKVHEHLSYETNIGNSSFQRAQLFQLAQTGISSMQWHYTSECVESSVHSAWEARCPNVLYRETSTSSIKNKALQKLGSTIQRSQDIMEPQDISHMALKKVASSSRERASQGFLMAVVSTKWCHKVALLRADTKISIEASPLFPFRRNYHTQI